MVTTMNVLPLFYPQKAKNAVTCSVTTFREILKVVPPGIVIPIQVALYLHFEESQTPQSPPIAPPQNCLILRIVKADDFLLAKILILGEKLPISPL